jgi:hypothetical protein
MTEEKRVRSALGGNVVGEVIIRDGVVAFYSASLYEATQARASAAEARVRELEEAKAAGACYHSGCKVDQALKEYTNMGDVITCPPVNPEGAALSLQERAESVQKQLAKIEEAKKVSQETMNRRVDF